MPTATDYSQAIQNLRVAVDDEELKAGEVAVDPMGLPLQYSGNFAVVFRVHCPQTQKSWAVKCFTKDVDHRAERYGAISQHLQQVKLPFMVGFQYQEKGILVSGRWYPIVKMDWVEGEALNRFVAANLDKPRTLRQLLGLWLKLAERLREAQVTHADLQHGNVLLVPAKDREGHRLMLVDYDGMYVPALARQPSGELGHPAYQHPERQRDGVYSAEVDRFSHLAICCAVQSLMVGRRRLWEKFDNGDNLLFRATDFQNPGTSEVFQELWRLGDARAHALVGRLALATQMPLDRVPWLDKVLTNGHVTPLTSGEEKEVQALMGPGRARVHPVPRVTPDEIVASWIEQKPKAAPLPRPSAKPATKGASPVQPAPARSGPTPSAGTIERVRRTPGKLQDSGSSPREQNLLLLGAIAGVLVLILPALCLIFAPPVVMLICYCLVVPYVVLGGLILSFGPNSNDFPFWTTDRIHIRFSFALAASAVGLCLAAPLVPFFLLGCGLSTVFTIRFLQKFDVLPKDFDFSEDPRAGCHMLLMIVVVLIAAVLRFCLT